MSLINITLHIVVTTGGTTSGKLRHVLKKSEEAYHAPFVYQRLSKVVRNGLWIAFMLIIGNLSVD